MPTPAGVVLAALAGRLLILTSLPYPFLSFFTGSPGPGHGMLVAALHLRRRARPPWVARRGLASCSSTARDEEHGVAVLRRATAAGSMGGAVEEASNAWAEAGMGPIRPALHVVHVHDPDILLAGRSSRPRHGSEAPVVAITAELNQLDIDLSGAEDGDVRLVSLVGHVCVLGGLVGHWNAFISLQTLLTHAFV